MVLVVLSCTHQGDAVPTTSSTIQERPTARPVTDYTTFIAASEAAGFAVERGGQRGTSYLSRFLEVPGRGVAIDGELVSAYEFPSGRALREMRSTISPRGDTMGSAIISWDPPRFYSAGSLLVVYFGEDDRTLDILRDLLGPKFAGG